MDEDGQGRPIASTSAAPLLFKKRSRNRGNNQNGGEESRSGSGTPTRVSEAQRRISRLHAHEEEDDGEDEDAGSSALQGVVRRTGTQRNSARSTGARMVDVDARSTLSTTRLHDIGLSREDEEAFDVRKDAIANRSILDAASSLPSYMEAQASMTDSAYSPAALAALKASTPSRNAADVLSDGNSSLDIPSDAVIRAAKERRRRLALEESGGQILASDFISLRQDAGPHPESRLQREEDELGSGEEDFARYTGATERVAIEQNAIRSEQVAERESRREAIEMTVDEEENETDESEREWERAQMSKMTDYLGKKERDLRKERSGRTQSFRPAPIPHPTSLPSLLLISNHLEAKLVSVQEAITSHAQIQDDAKKKLEQLKGDEERNKRDIRSAAEREAWFREFEEFIITVASLLEQKVPRLREVEVKWMEQLKIRNGLIQQARANALVDQMSLFLGVPPSWPAAIVDGDEQARSPSDDGDALSERRVLRRQTAQQALSGRLPPAELAGFLFEQQNVTRQAEQLLDDVRAAEFRDVAARIVNDDGSTRIHPASLVARFHRWRRSYAQPYNEAWGGLTLASICDFWIRRSFCGWDVLHIQQELPRRTLDGFPWYAELSRYAEKGQTSPDTNTDDLSNQPVGGDEEIVAHAFTNSVIPYMIKICGSNGGVAFDAWSSESNASMLDIVEQMTYVLEKDNARLQALISVILDTFRANVEALSASLKDRPSLDPPAMSPDGPASLLSFTQYVYLGLARQLLLWNRFVVASHRNSYVDLVEFAISSGVLPLFGMARLVVGGEDMVAINAKDLLARTSRSNLLNDETRSRVEALCGQSSLSVVA